MQSTTILAVLYNIATSRIIGVYYFNERINSLQYYLDGFYSCIRPSLDAANVTTKGGYSIL